MEFPIAPTAKNGLFEQLGVLFGAGSEKVVKIIKRLGIKCSILNNKSNISNFKFKLIKIT